MKKTALEKYLKLSLKQYNLPNWAKFRGDHDSQSCIFDEAENVVGLILKNTKLTKITLPDLPYLAYCCISDNEKLTALTLEGSFPVLAYLDISDNQLTSFTIANDFPQLDRIDISRNKLKKFTVNGALPVLNMLDLSGNPMKNVDVDMLEKMPELEYLYLHQNPLNLSIGAYRKDGANYLQAAKKLKAALDSGERVKNEEYKVLLVGDGKTGKSCVVNRLVNDHFNPEWDSTHGISVQQFKDTDNRYDFPYTLNLWDFGGQDIYHTTHRLFMQNNTTYLLLWNEETEIENEFSERKEGRKMRKWLNRRYKYWLRYIAYIGKKSPLLIIQTKDAKGGNKHPHKQDILDRYEDYFPYLEFLAIDSIDPQPKESGYKKMMNRLEEAIEELEREEWLPKRWVMIRDALLAKRPDANAATKNEFLNLEDKFMSLADYRKLATAAGEAEPDQLLTNWLVKTGVVFYKKGLFDDKIILNQEWAIKAIYTLFDRGDDGFYYEIKERNGRFSGKELRTYWGGYPQNVQELFLGFMLNSEMCFEVRSKDEERNASRTFEQRQFIAIELMSGKRPRIFEERESNWAANGDTIVYMRYQHPFLHQGIIQSFIARTHEFAEVSDMYKKGILLEMENTKAIIEANEESDEILIKLPLVDERLLDRIRNEFENIQKTDENPVEELVSLDGKVFVNIKELLDAKEKKETRIKAACGTFVEVNNFAIFMAKDEKETFENARQEKTKLKSMEKVRNLIASGRLDQALTLLSKEYNSTEVIQLQERLSTLSRDNRMGILSNAEANLERNKITASTLALLAELNKPSITNEVKKEKPIIEKTEEEAETPSPKIYFSYAWGDDKEEGESREKTVKELYESLVNDGFNVIRDKEGVQFGASIIEFMESLANGDLIVVFTSAKYFESSYCMFELNKIGEKCGYDKTQFQNRILPIPVEFINFKDRKVRAKYKDFWLKEEKELGDYVAKYRSTMSQWEWDEYEFAKNLNSLYFSKLTGFLVQLNQSTISLLSKNDFDLVKQTIKDRFKNIS